MSQTGYVYLKIYVIWCHELTLIRSGGGGGGNLPPTFLYIIFQKMWPGSLLLFILFRFCS